MSTKGHYQMKVRVAMVPGQAAHHADISFVYRHVGDTPVALQPRWPFAKHSTGEVMDLVVGDMVVVSRFGCLQICMVG